jgi:hypothetical protein
MLNHVLVGAAAIITAAGPLAAQNGCATCWSAGPTHIDSGAPNRDRYSEVATTLAKDTWRFTVASSFVFPAMQGTTGIAFLPPVKVSSVPGEIFSRLQAGGMLSFEASQGPWSIVLDGMYVELKRPTEDVYIGANQNCISSECPPVPALVAVPGSVTMKQGMLEGFVFRAVSRAIEVAVGGVGSHIQASIALAIPGSSATPADVTRSNVEVWGTPVVGARWIPIDEDHWHMSVFGDIGGVSGNNWTWQALPSLGYRFSRVFELSAQYRGIGINYKTGSSKSVNVHGVNFGLASNAFSYDVILLGPQLGLVFHF